MAQEEIDSIDVGRRLRIVRETAGITQSAAAATINVARTTLVAIEKGQRAIRTAELLPLARLYDTSVNSLLRHESVYVDFVPRFRKLPDCKDDPSAKAARLLADLVRAEAELQNLLGITPSRNSPPHGGITNEQAQQLLGDLTAVDADHLEAKRPTTLRLSLLAAEAWRQELLSEGQLARLLQLGRVELREILDGIEAEREDAGRAPRLSE